MKLAFVFDGLGCGGIERVGIDYCNALCNAGHEIIVVNLSPQKMNLFISWIAKFNITRFPFRSYALLNAMYL